MSDKVTVHISGTATIDFSTEITITREQYKKLTDIIENIGQSDMLDKYLHELGVELEHVYDPYWADIEDIEINEDE